MNRFTHFVLYEAEKHSRVYQPKFVSSLLLRLVEPWRQNVVSYNKNFKKRLLFYAVAFSGYYLLLTIPNLFVCLLWPPYIHLFCVRCWGFQETSSTPMRHIKTMFFGGELLRYRLFSWTDRLRSGRVSEFWASFLFRLFVMLCLRQHIHTTQASASHTPPILAYWRTASTIWHWCDVTGAGCCPKVLLWGFPLLRKSCGLLKSRKLCIAEQKLPKKTDFLWGLHGAESLIKLYMFGCMGL